MYKDDSSVESLTVEDLKNIIRNVVKEELVKHPIIQTVMNPVPLYYTDYDYRRYQVYCTDHTDPIKGEVK